MPFVLLAGHWTPRLADPTLLWLATALASTLAGNLTVVGSVANLIVLQLAGERGRIGFWRFLRYGAAVTGLPWRFPWRSCSPSAPPASSGDLAGRRNKERSGPYALA